MAARKGTRLAEKLRWVLLRVVLFRDTGPVSFLTGAAVSFSRTVYRKRLMF